MEKKSPQRRPPMNDRQRAAKGMPAHGTPHGRSGGGANTLASGSVDWFATLSRGRPTEPADIRYRLLQGGSGQLWLIVLDSSGSTLKNHGLSAAKGALASLFDMAYVQRARIGLLQFAGTKVKLSIPPQRAPKQNLELIEDIAGGGGTPLRQGLEAAIRVLKRERRRFPDEQQALVLFTDGRSRDPIDDIQAPCRTLVIDTETDPIRLGRCRQLASILNGEYLVLENLPIKRRND